MELHFQTVQLYLMELLLIGGRKLENCIINSGALIEHDVRVGNNVHISTKTTLNGNVKVGNNTFVGSGCIVKEGTVIGDNCIIGMGKLIKKNIKNNSLIK